MPILSHHSIESLLSTCGHTDTSSSQSLSNEFCISPLPVHLKETTMIYQIQYNSHSIDNIKQHDYVNFLYEREYRYSSSPGMGHLIGECNGFGRLRELHPSPIPTECNFSASDNFMRINSSKNTGIDSSSSNTSCTSDLMFQFDAADLHWMNR
jgi:hypothetical protein